MAGSLLAKKRWQIGKAGWRFHIPFQVTVALSKAAPRLFQCLTRSATMPKVELEFWQLIEGGKEEQYFQILLEEACLVHAATRMLNNKRPEDAQEPVLLKLGFSYQKITWHSDKGYLFFTDPEDDGRGAVPEKAKPASDFEPIAEKKEEAEKVLLKNPVWVSKEVGFNEDAEVSVEVEIPEVYAGRKKVLFELWAKTPKGPERISQAEGFSQNGKAIARIPLYYPNYREDGKPLEKADYFFTAKHTLSERLESDKTEKGIKEVDYLSDPLLDTHTLEGISFGFDSSFLHPDQSPKLEALCQRLTSWKQEHPHGKLALFGHTDAVGKEAYNKGLSERRAKAVYAYLMKDVSVWEDLYKEENWGLRSVQTLVKYFGFDPGVIDGKDGAKTQAAVKAFQKEKGLAVDGIAGPMTR